MNVYLDNGATTDIAPEVWEAIKSAPFGNASSLHTLGINAHQTLMEARESIAQAIGCTACEIIFTSGGTEANNFAIKGTAFKAKKGHIITTKIEHDCVLNSCKWLETQGFSVTYLDVDENGFVNPENLEDAIQPDTIIVSIIHGNNEIGTIQDLTELSAICKKHNVLFHIDACQSFTKTPIDLSLVDMMTINSHKIHGPKGVGALYIKKHLRITPLFHGGGQERRYRSGTENIPAIIGFAKAIAIKQDNNKITTLRDKLIDGILASVPGSSLNGPKENRLCNNVNISFEKVEGESIIELLSLSGISASTGSACSSKSLEPSHVIMALGRDIEAAHGSVRFSLSRYTTEEEISYVLETLPRIIAKLTAMSPLQEV
jgi:cysteine desulfurase